VSDPNETPPPPEYAPDEDIVAPEIREGEGKRVYMDRDASADE
jgi:hypothetical protein